ncbi:hypothetical protein WJX75_002777 [Coccomyxa subellipsoidea]|uniref:phytol kinase n=1 Tax=Coccomyxa subellipsoidea TaxID=248742 RepID=A0ABR2YMN1_9CHLO
MHIGNGLLFVLFWPCYTEHYVSKYLCASVPLMAALHFALVGMGAVADASLVASATRTGDRRELLHGPLLYGTIIGALTIIFWRGSPSGVAAIAVLCAGDGLADIVGRRLGTSNKLPYSPNKSAAGTMACVGAAVESLPLTEVDNWTVPLAAALSARLFFGF